MQVAGLARGAGVAAILALVELDDAIEAVLRVEAAGTEGVGLGRLDAETQVDLEGNSLTYYINLPITLAKGVFIVPEISIFDLGENDTDGTAVENGQRTVFGAKFQVDF